MRVCNVAEGCPSFDACWHAKPHNYEDSQFPAAAERLCLSDSCPLHGHMSSICVPVGDEEDIT